MRRLRELHSGLALKLLRRSGRMAAIRTRGAGRWRAERRRFRQAFPVSSWTFLLWEYGGKVADIAKSIEVVMRIGTLGFWDHFSFQAGDVRDETVFQITYFIRRMAQAIISRRPDPTWTSDIALGFVQEASASSKVCSFSTPFSLYRICMDAPFSRQVGPDGPTC